ncbi:response regulator [Ketobacter sp. MCCC 1A13808]|uniref:response regulator n=1 Tax=Ketobacter sp. MCCC 1A13808 TaxID=2602738 RepID=UPI0012EC8F30|nr:response regulator [Ketobacter sp. MCCC 1A13808]MVF12097.1 response regulator [Ketobacter sp. MCCC 1A13808]
MQPQRFNILCVDDDLGFRRYLSKSLNEQYNIRFYALGFECLTQCQDWNFDLVMVDATLPDMVSEQLVEKLKAKPDLATTPVVIVSYKNSDKERARFAQCGSDHFLSKVASPQEIKALLSDAISKAA